MKKLSNSAFIDGQNLNREVRRLGWQLDMKKFRIYLKDKYDVKTAYYFIGYVEGNSPLYMSLQAAGYVLVFKPTVPDHEGKIKGNCDAELVLQAMIDYKKYNRAVIVTGDGDFACLISYLRDHEKLATVLIPNKYKYSSLIRRISLGQYCAFMNNLRNKLEYIKKKRTP